MVSASNLAAFALASFILIIIPGPSVLFVITRGVVLGRRAALATVLGNCAGVYVQVAAVALGIGVLVERSAVVYNAVKLARRRLSRVPRREDVPAAAVAGSRARCAGDAEERPADPPRGLRRRA